MELNTACSPTISVIIPVYNGAKTIEHTIKSVQNQTVSNWEILVIDNGSTDKTESLVQNISNTDKRVKLLKSAKGRSLARNKGLDSAHGKYINFLDADDQLTNQHMERGLTFLDRNNDFFAYVENTEYINEKFQKISVVNESHEKNLSKENPFEISSVLFRRTDNIVTFMIGLDHNEDWLFWYQNLIHKKIEIRYDLIGERKLVTGNNTMLDLNNMLGSEIIVLSKINAKTSLLRKTKLMFMFFRSKYKNEEKFVNIVEKKFQYIYVFIKIVSKMPLIYKIINYFISYKIRLMSKKSMY
ncbi:MAG: glycosyltransferase family 2 protein [Leuconostoc mesenteroides]|jgi:glycosyltransferase involved in cell wall biosynthesis|uniref:glycosyltransferase family 2 protein n=1 Tax=Leuconostoc sp. LN180020 TaxID=2571156 RepID=UPI001784E633|nr:glycosyltransferase family 2 protein [Leuconostoc sp. LN180020]MCH3933481.1 glycosyltransferase family 2 protein [Leuconostoc mesenteroides]MCI1878160.1 glycosyltransferase family 2 protein [Leuconostoc mesenteroides]MCI1907701.1 glycosyltransferase family 2 protein [Leuconostoc mesenteroides]QOG10373.1 glycosyltransferase family 2 protein [Leuconostoc sp. LN180020]